MMKEVLFLTLSIGIISCNSESKSEGGSSEEKVEPTNQEIKTPEFIGIFDSCEGINKAEFFPDLMGESELATYDEFLRDMELEENFHIKAEYSFDSLGIYLYISYNDHLTQGLLAELKGEEKFLEIDIRPMNGSPISAGRYEVDTDVDVELAMFVVYMEDGSEKLKFIGNDMGLTYLTINKHQDGELCGKIEVFNMGNELTKKFSFNCHIESFSL